MKLPLCYSPHIETNNKITVYKYPALVMFLSNMQQASSFSSRGTGRGMPFKKARRGGGGGVAMGQVRRPILTGEQTAALVREIKEEFAPEMANWAQTALDALEKMQDAERRMVEKFIEKGGSKLDSKSTTFSEHNDLQYIRQGVEEVAAKAGEFVAAAANAVEVVGSVPAAVALSDEAA